MTVRPEGLSKPQHRHSCKRASALRNFSLFAHDRRRKYLDLCAPALVRPPFTAVLRQIAEQRVHRVEAWGVNHRSAVTSHSDQSGRTEAIKMKGQSVGRQVECLRDIASSKPLQPGLDEQPEYSEAIVLCEGGQRGQRIRLFHISKNMEIYCPCQES